MDGPKGDERGRWRWPQGECWSQRGDPLGSFLFARAFDENRQILKGSVETWLGYISGVAADSHGVWFGGDKGIYLYSESGALKKVTDQAGIPAGTCA